jgi:hypothetical protein
VRLVCTAQTGRCAAPDRFIGRLRQYLGFVDVALSIEQPPVALRDDLDLTGYHLDGRLFIDGVQGVVELRCPLLRMFAIGK